MWETLVAAVVAKVRESTLVDSSHVYDHRKRTFDAYPAVVVAASDTLDPAFADTDRNRRTYLISVRIFQERSEQGDSNAERILREIADDLIAKFDADAYLNNTLAGRGFTRPIPGRFLEPPTVGEGPDLIGMEILVECVVIE